MPMFVIDPLESIHIHEEQTKWPSIPTHFVEPSPQAEFSPTPVSQIGQRTQQRHLVDFFETFKLGVFWKALAKNLHCPDDSLIRIPQGDRTNQDWQMTPVLMMKMKLSLPRLAVSNGVCCWALLFFAGVPQDVVATAFSQDF